MERRLAAILVADAVGYSRLMGLDEVGTHTQFKTHLNELLSPQISAHKGRIVKTTGDGLLAEFSSVVDAVECAVCMQEAVFEHNADLSDERRMNYRMGINLGEIIVEQDDIYGDGVNIAARLETLAEPGGICLSGDTYRQVRKRVEFRFEDLGEQQVKNIDEPIHVFRLVTGGPGADYPTAVPVSTSELAEKPSIVVLPFDNLNRDPDQEYFCDGLTQDLTTDLSRFANLFVIAANSAFTFKGRPTKAQDVRRELGVRYMLEGSIQRAGARVRVNAQLIDAGTGHHLWADRFDRSTEDPFALQDEIIQKIVAALAIELDAAEQQRVMRKEPGNLSAYDAYLKGVHIFSQESQESLDQSRVLFEEAIQQDPNFSRAYGYLAYIQVQFWLGGWSDAGALEEAERLAKRAIAIDPNDYANHWDLAFVYLNQKRFFQARHEYETALAHNPNDANLLVEMAEMLIFSGEFDRAIAQIEKAMLLNPHVPDWYRWILAWGYYFVRNYAGTLEEIDTMRHPLNEVLLIVAAAEAQLGHTAQARDTMKRFLEGKPGWSIEKEHESLSFKQRDHEEHWLDGLRRAGMPETETAEELRRKE